MNATSTYVTKGDKIIWRSLIAAFTVPSLIFLVLTFWPLNPLEIKSVTIMNLHKTATMGDDIIFQVHYVKRTGMHGKVYRQLINDRVINYRPHISSVPVGERKGIGVLHMGKEEVPGKYQVNYTVVYRYFGFREVSVSGLSDEITIVERKG